MGRGGIEKVSQIGLDEGQQVQETEEADGEGEVWENMELVNLKFDVICEKGNGWWG